jgi:uncharacterized membrane protein
MSTILDFNQDPIWNILLRFLITLFVLFIVIRVIYYRYSRRERRAFSFFQMGIMIFLVCILLKNVEIQLGMALGLFAIFAILRFRSRNLSLREMTYFFTVIGIAVINSMANFYNPVRGTILINLIIIVSLFLLEMFFSRRDTTSATLIYNRLDLLGPDKTEELISDISARSGNRIDKVEIKKIDLVKNTAELEIFFKDKDAEN